MPGVDLVNNDDDLVNPRNRSGWKDLEGPINLPLTGSQPAAGNPTSTPTDGHDHPDH